MKINILTRKLTVLLFAILVTVFAAVATTVEGTKIEYAGKELQFFRYADPVTKQKIPVFKLKFDAAGNFSAQVEVKTHTFVFCEFGIYRGLLFLEPQKTVQLRFPPWREKSFADQKNPFFQPVEFWFATQQGNLLNDHISAFDTQLNQLTDKYFNQLYFNQSEAIYDTITHLLNNQFQDVDSPVFEAHKELKLQVVKADAFRLSPAKLAGAFNTAKPEFWTHLAFIELFEKTFDNKLSFEIKKVNNSALIDAVAQENTGFLLTSAKKNYGLKSPASELVLLKMLHDGFYSGDFPKEKIISILSSEKLQNNANKNIAAIAQNVKEKLDFLLPGSKAPMVCLKNTDGNPLCTNNNKDKFKYFIFADTEMVVCREHLKYLPKIEEQFGEHLEIFVILRKTDLIDMKIFLDKQEVPGTHLIDEKGEIIEQYRVKSFPVCILLNENHEVVFSPAQAPLDGFEQQFGKYLQRHLFEKQRNQAR
jgi:peroxiredoxin